MSVRFKHALCDWMGALFVNYGCCDVVCGVFSCKSIKNVDNKAMDAALDGNATKTVDYDLSSDHINIERRESTLELIAASLCGKKKDGLDDESVVKVNGIMHNENAFCLSPIVAAGERKCEIELHYPAKQVTTSMEGEMSETKHSKDLFEPRLFGGETSILTSCNAQLLHSWLPIRYNWLDWKLLYNLNVDGCSMLTFYEKCADKGPLIMIIKDERGYIFGVFIAQTQDLSDTGRKKRFFGGADTFVFRLYPNANKYEWAKINRFFVYFDLQNINNASITIGGGSSPALTLLSNLSKGISAKCDTFNNPQLSSSQDFTCISLEVWGFIDYK